MACKYWVSENAGAIFKVGDVTEHGVGNVKLQTKW